MNRRIVITGVSRGLGRALVEEFVRAGAQVAGCARDATAIDELSSRHPKGNHFSIVNVANEQEVANWAGRVLNEFGVPDLLINNAALINQTAPLWKVPVDEFRRLIDVNVTGVFYVLRYFVPHMVEQKTGVIVNLSSGWGRSVSADVAPYCASKYAIEGLTLALAEELPKGMAAVPLNPGVINTDMLQQCWADGANAYPAPEQWAKKAAPFILRLSASHNGKSLSVSG